MEKSTINIEKVLTQHIEKIGVELNIIPRFIKDLVNSSFDDPSISLMQINNRLHLLGWNDIILDYHTYQLAIAYFETDNLKDRKYK